MDMSPKELKHKPLVEAILEVRWKLQGEVPGGQTDPHYKILLGRLFDRMLKEYPVHEQLPTANIPDEFVGYVVQHRFRVADNSWPLVQVGPGIFTLNSTSDYKWSDFLPRALTAVNQLYDAHPKSENLKITNIVLRYIDSTGFDFVNRNTFEFLRDKLKIDISLPNNFFEGTNVETFPSSLTFQSSFKCDKPKGIINVGLATGQNNNAPALIWETTVESAGGDLPEMPGAFESWIEAAHAITNDWFFKMIEGELKRSFSCE